MRLAIYGGTFDPIHCGHLVVAAEAATRFQLDRVLFVPAAHPPHKEGATHAAYEHRVRMAELATADDPRFAVSRIEAETERSYSILTIEKVRATLAPGDELFFLIGADAFAEIQSWLRWRDVVANVTFIVVSRPGHHYEIPSEARVLALDTVHLRIASSGIREDFARGHSPLEVPASVRDYIRENRLY